MLLLAFPYLINCLHLLQFALLNHLLLELSRLYTLLVCNILKFLLLRPLLAFCSRLHFLQQHSFFFLYSQMVFRLLFHILLELALFCVDFHMLLLLCQLNFLFLFHSNCLDMHILRCLSLLLPLHLCIFAMLFYLVLMFLFCLCIRCQLLLSFELTVYFLLMFSFSLVFCFLLLGLHLLSLVTYLALFQLLLIVQIVMLPLGRVL